MAQDCNQRIFGNGLSASIHPPRTGLFASQPAINRLGLQSTVVGPHYLQLDALTVLGPSFFALQRMRIWRAPWRGSCLACLWTCSLERLPRLETTLLRHHNCLACHVPCGYP